MSSWGPLQCRGTYTQKYKIHTVFIRIVAVATINFSLAWVQLLIEGSSYSRAAFINFGSILDGEIHKIAAQKVDF